MRLATMARPPMADDVAAALTGAVRMLGQRPAVTGLVPDRREQGFASLAGWVAKGANLLHTELGLAPGDRVALAGPPGWPLAAVAVSAWWLGVTVVPTVPGGPRPAVLVQHAALLDAPQDVDHASVPRFVFGDALDGTGSIGARGAGARGVEQWTDAVTPHGDRPPPALHDGDAVAFVASDGAVHTQRTLLADVALEGDGVLGLLRGREEDLLARPDAARRLAALALRPLVTGSATVVVAVDDPARDAHAAAERVTRWHA